MPQRKPPSRQSIGSRFDSKPWTSLPSTDRHPTADQDPHGHTGTWRHVQLVKWHLDTPEPPTWILFSRKQSKIQAKLPTTKAEGNGGFREVTHHLFGL